ncbi:aspartate ammonia-lyase, partial [candidate division KSB1 bacterium]|nr:aspartate ammonia-lyase [candidate division KSB1 bacterium]
RSAFGPDQRLVVFSKHDFLGEAALFEESPRSTSATALVDTTVFVLRRVEFLKLIQKYPMIGTKLLLRIMQVITRRMQQATAHVHNSAAQYISGRNRQEHDLIGIREVPFEAYYGIQTLRGVENFNITGVPISHYPELIEALALVKMAAAMANQETSVIPDKVATAIIQACQEILQGKLHDQFVVDLIQGGAGTSTNMNINEVVANRALEILGHRRGEYEFCHPNNHVNASQSTNDAYPTALKIAILNCNTKLIQALQSLIASFEQKAREFAHIIKMGRTQLQDAVPMTLGQEFEAYAVTLSEEIDRLQQNVRLFLEVNMGGTAIGTGLNTVANYREKVIVHLRAVTGFEVVSAPNLIEATQDAGAFLMYASTLKRLAVKLSKICNDLRLLSSGPRAGFNEINLPKMQPGSSIMPGKVNPVIPEVVNQIAFKVIGNDLAVTLAVEAGQLELNVMEPLIAESVFSSMEMLKNGINTLKYRCIDGITANEARCRDYVEQSIGLATALVPVLGYEVATELAQMAAATNRGIYELVLEKQLLSQVELDQILNPRHMVNPQFGSLA